MGSSNWPTYTVRPPQPLCACLLAARPVDLFDRATHAAADAPEYRFLGGSGNRLGPYADGSGAADGVVGAAVDAVVAVADVDVVAAASVG